VEALVGAIVGAVIALVTSVIVQRMENDRASDLQQKQWDHEQRVEVNRFQRDTLAELQVQLEELVKTAGSLDAQRREMYRNATPAQLAADAVPTSEQYQDTARRFREARSRLVILGVRVEDPGVRDQLEPMYRLANELANTPPARWDQLVRAGKLEKDPGIELVDLHLETNRAIGKLLHERQ
jgi:hypothetical protein